MDQQQLARLEDSIIEIYLRLTKAVGRIIVPQYGEQGEHPDLLTTDA